MKIKMKSAFNLNPCVFNMSWFVLDNIKSTKTIHCKVRKNLCSPYFNIFSIR